jgi:L-asparaginase
MAPFTLVVQQLTLPALVIHGGAGAYLKTTSRGQRLERGRTLAEITQQAHRCFRKGDARAAVLAAMASLERDPSFNAGYGARLQRDGEARLSAALMDGRKTRLSAVYNVQGCHYPSALCDALQDRGDRSLDGEGASLLMAELGVEPTDVVTPQTRERWQKLVATGDTADREAAIGSAGEDELDLARALRLPIPKDLERDGTTDPGTSEDQRSHDLPPPEDRYGTVGAVGCDAQGNLWASTSTGGRGHEVTGRISDTPTPAGNYACPVVALSATGFGEQIIDLNLCGRVATRMLDGASLEQALRRTFDEVAAFDGLVGVVAITAEGMAGYAHSTEACGVAWLDGSGALHVDQHGADRAG